MTGDAYRPGPRVRLAGTVVAFDIEVGLGEVETGAVAGQVAAFGSGPGTGAAPMAPPMRYRFHCTQIADGSRSIAVGTAVSFGLLAGRDGRWEAGSVQPVVGLGGSPRRPGGAG